MIELRLPLQVEPVPGGEWQLIFWLGECFDYTTPFRSTLATIATLLGSDCHLSLPDYESGEDFVEGTLQFGTIMLRVYYEYSLSYLAFISDGEGVLTEIAERLKPRCRCFAKIVE